jgi:hypothetical protein
VNRRIPNFLLRQTWMLADIRGPSANVHRHSKLKIIKKIGKKLSSLAIKISK